MKCSGQPKIRGSNEILEQSQTKPLEPDAEQSQRVTVHGHVWSKPCVASFNEVRREHGNSEEMLNGVISNERNVFHTVEGRGVSRTAESSG